MGFFDAFLRGAAGPGFSELARSNERRDELEAERKRRDQDREDQQKFREQQAALDRELRAGRSRSRGTGGGGGDAPEDDERAGVLGIIAKYGVSDPDARKLYAATKSGQNPYTRETQTPEQIDDGDRKRTVTVGGTAPDMDRWMELNRTVAESIMASGGNPEQNADARIKQRRLKAAEGYAKGDVAEGRVGVMLGASKGEFDADGTSGLTGLAPAGSQADAKIASEKALQAERYASADKSKAGAAKDKSEAKDADLNRAKAPYEARIKAAESDTLLKLPSNADKLAARIASIRAEMDADPEIIRLRANVKPAKTEGPAKSAPADVLKQAKDAIARGADRAKIKARLKELGYSDVGL